MEKKPPARKASESDENYDDSDFEDGKEESENPVDALRKKIAKENTKALNYQKKREENHKAERASPNTSVLRAGPKTGGNGVGGKMESFAIV